MQLARRSFLLGLGAAVAAPAVVHATSLMPISARLILPPKTEIIGAIKPSIGKIPDGWIECNGRWLSKVNHSDLYAVIGDKYSGAFQADTFNVPDMRVQAWAVCSHDNPIGRYVIYGGDQSSAHRRDIDGITARDIRSNVLPAEKQDIWHTLNGFGELKI